MTEQGPQDIGTRLRLAREQSGLSLRQIADTTKLSVRALDALERGRVTLLPGGIYRRSIVRAYATEIGLDPEVTLLAFLDQHPDDLPAPQSSARAQTSTPADVVVEVPARPRALQGVLSLFGALVPVVAGVLYFSVGARGADEPRPLADLDTPVVVDVRRSEVVPVGGLAEVPRPMSRAVPMLISVSSRCQLQVVADGREVVGRSLEAGELLQLDLGHDVVFLGDNAGAVHFSINGRAGRQLGEAGTPLNVRIGRDDYEAWLVPLD